MKTVSLSNKIIHKHLDEFMDDFAATCAILNTNIFDVNAFNHEKP